MADEHIDALIGKEEENTGEDTENQETAGGEEEQADESQASDQEAGAAEEADEGEEPEGNGEDKEAGTVPVAALHEARSESRELRSQLQDTREKMARMEALFEQLQKGDEKSQGEAASDIPKYEDDPEGYYQATIRHLESRLSNIEKQGEERQQSDQHNAEVQKFMDQYNASVRTFSTDHPDFDEAYDWLAKTVDQDLAARGVDDPTERYNILKQEEGFMVGRALKTGKNPAEIIYNYARSRGFKPSGAEDENKLERLEKGSKASKSLSGSKAKGEGQMTLERLAELDGEEFDKAWAEAQRKGLL